MPIKPARAEQIAPTIKDTATIPLEPTSACPLKNKRTATAATNMDNILYSAFKKDMAPSAIFDAIRAIFSLPTSCLETQLFFIKTNSRAKTPNAGKNLINNSMILCCLKVCVKVVKQSRIQNQF